MQTTYTIAYSHSLLWACEPDGSDMERAFTDLEASSDVCVPRGEVTIESGLILTDEAPEDESLVVFRAGPHTGELSDDRGIAYRYAVRL